MCPLAQAGNDPHSIDEKMAIADQVNVHYASISSNFKFVSDHKKLFELIKSIKANGKSFYSQYADTQDL